MFALSISRTAMPSSGADERTPLWRRPITLAVVCLLAFVSGVFAIDRTTPALLDQITFGDARLAADRWIAASRRTLSLPGHPPAPGWLDRVPLWLASSQGVSDLSHDVDGFILLDANEERDGAMRDLARGGELLLDPGGTEGTALLGAARRSAAVQAFHLTEDERANTVGVAVPLLREGRVDAVLYIEVRRPAIAPRIRNGIRRALLVLASLSIAASLAALSVILVLGARAGAITKRARFLAERDHLTGCFNRRAFMERAHAATEQPDPHALLLIDLRRFAVLNDRLGGAACDMIVQGVLERLERAFRRDRATAQAGACLGRPDSDTFAVLFPCASRERLEAACQAATAIASEPFEHDKGSTEIDVAVGGAIHPWDAEGLQDWMATVRLGLRHARAKPHSAFSAFDADMARDAREERDIEAALPEGIAQNQFRMIYQPQIRIEGDSREIIGYEALMRWVHPRIGAISPGRFIPIAERGGEILALGTLSLEDACREATRWSARNRHVAVNLSPAQLAEGTSDATIVSQVDRVLTETRLSPRRLQLEITEGLLLDGSRRVRTMMNDLRGLGVSLALDDFGTGYSSLSYLANVPVDKVKLDRAFVSGLEEDARARSVVEGLVALCGSLGMGVIAEGVETERQGALLVDLGCDVHQGFLYGRPGPVEN